jgi:GntR family transcriptional regulator/MocR family aminotransferase
MRVLCRERRGALVEALRLEFGGALAVLGDEAGMFLTAALPEGWSDREICEAAARQELWVAPLSEAYLGKVLRQGLILGYGGSTVEEIKAGIRRLRDVARSCSTPQRLVTDFGRRRARRTGS